MAKDDIGRKLKNLSLAMDNFTDSPANILHKYKESTSVYIGEAKKSPIHHRKEENMKPARRKYSCVEHKPLPINPALTRRRRHTWAVGNPSPLNVSSESPDIPGTPLSKCSSASSVSEVIEECPSDEELEVETETIQSFDYMKCKSCNKIKNSADDKFSDNTDYCFTCRKFYSMTELLRKQGVAEKQRRSSWADGDKRDVYLPLKTLRRRGSDSGAIELPVISEPDIDDVS